MSERVYDAHDADLSIGEPHGGHIQGRPISWVIVALVSGGFIAAGVGLSTALPWLFIVGLAVVVLAGILGWATHAMADASARVERKSARAHAAELRRAAATETGANLDGPPIARLATEDADRDGSQTSVRG